MSNKKGFTLIEILAAVTILGILSIVAVVSVNKIIQKSKMNYYTTAEKNLEMAGQSYVQQNRSKLPKAIGQKVKISLSTLVNKNYIEPIKDYNDNECNLENSYVQVFKYSRDDYSYLAFLDCPVYDSKDQIQKGKPQITIVLTNPLSTKTAKAQISVTDSEKLLSWSYIVYKNGKEVLNSGNIMLPNYDKAIDKVLNISKFTPGEIKVVVTATNIYGLTTNKTSEILEYKDTSGPICIIKEEDKKTNPKPWTQEYRTITVGCDDGEGSGCTREEYTKTFKSTTDVGKIVIEDESGNKTNCEVSVNVDRTAPECTVTLTGTSGDNGWYKTKNVAVKLNTEDDHSGVGAYDLTTLTTASYNGNNNASQGNTSGIIWYGYVKDNVGNVNKCNSGSFKVDTQKPVCTVSLSGTIGTNGWYKSNNVSITLNPSDNLSGVSKTGLGTNSSPTLGSTTSGSQGNTTGITWYGKVKDAAGNVSDVCDSGSFKVDKSNPSCSISVSTSGLTLTASDSGSSGVSSSSINGGGTSVSLGTGTFNGSVIDNAGNSGSCSRTVVNKSSSPHCGDYSTDSSGTCYYTNKDYYSVGASTCVCSNPGFGVTPAVWTHDGIPYPATSSQSCAGLCYGKGYGGSTYTPGTASCSRGSVSGSTCKITVTTPQGYNYYCESGYTAVGSYCYK